MNPVVHFEMPYENWERMTKFYQNVFEWKTSKLGAEMGDYVLVTTAESDAKPGAPAGAINGGFFPKRPDGAQHTCLVIGVKDIRQSMAKVKKAGGELVTDVMSIPGIGQYVTFLDTEKNRVSLLEPVGDM